MADYRRRSDPSPTAPGSSVNATSPSPLTNSSPSTKIDQVNRTSSGRSQASTKPGAVRRAEQAVNNAAKNNPRRYRAKNGE